MGEVGVSARRWVVLAVGTLSQAATSMFIYGIPMLLPALRSQDRMSLFAASLVVSAPVAGLLCTLIAWGAAADRFGERIVMGSGVSLSAVFLLATLFVRGAAPLCVLLALAGASGASVNAASGRLIMGWFTTRERGLAMGTRQTAQPLGVALAAIALPPLARDFDVRAALLAPAVFCAVLVVAILVVVADPPRPVRVAGEVTGSPYRGSWTLGRIHAASLLLAVPQFAMSAFTLVYLVGQRHWDAVAAGRLVFAFQFVGAAGRIATGIWSDFVRSRLGPMRQLAAASATLMALLAIGAATQAWWVVVIFGVAAVVTVADNGLAFVSVAEFAGSAWSGRAMGVQNTGQNIAGVLTAPVLAAVIGDTHYAVGFLLVAVCPLLAIPLTPVVAERHRRTQVTADRSR